MTEREPPDGAPLRLGKGEPETMTWSGEATLALIGSLRRKEVLWNSSSKSYKDRRRKAAAWKALEEEVGVPMELCKKRIESLLASCRRERKKIAESKAEDPPDEVYEPTWTYWNEFRFWRGLPDEEAVAEKTSEARDKSRWSPSARRPPRKRKKKIPPPEPTAPGPRKPIGDEFDAYGITVAAKLRKMDDGQRLLAENIINDTLYKGLTFRLNGTPPPPPEVFGARIQQTITRPPAEEAQWTSVEFANPQTAYQHKHPNIVRRESNEDFKQINMM